MVSLNLDNITFDSWSESYNTTPEINCIINNTKLRFSQNLLEIGCGSGRLTKRLHKYSNNYNCIDINNKPKEKLIQKVNFTYASGENIPFKNDSFEFILDGWALSAQNITKALSEYERVLQNNGQICIITESWDEENRENSDYVKILKKYDSNHLWPNLSQSIEKPIYDQFGSINKIPIKSEYTFKNSKTCVKAFKYHIEQYNGRKLSEEEYDDMYNYIKSSFSDDPVVLSEHATAYICEV